MYKYWGLAAFKLYYYQFILYHVVLKIVILSCGCHYSREQHKKKQNGKMPGGEDTSPSQGLLNSFKQCVYKYATTAWNSWFPLMMLHFSKRLLQTNSNLASWLAHTNVIFTAKSLHMRQGSALQPSHFIWSIN